MNTQSELLATHHYENTSDPLETLSTCLHSGTSSKVNYSYKNNNKNHEYEDTSFRLSFGGDSYYAILDGHDGSQVAHFARDTLISELCREHEMTDMRSHLENTITNVDKLLHDRIRPLLEERAAIKIKIAGTKNSYEAYQAYPDELQRLCEIEDQIKGGTTVVVSVIHDNNLYVANAGDSRAILCTYVDATDNANVEFKIDQLTEDHTTANDNELDRLAALGLNRQQIQEKRRVGSMETTRSIGDFAVKWGYKDFDILSESRGPPVISKPYVTPSFPIDNSFYFIFLMSDGVYHAVEEMTDCSASGDACQSPDPNIRIAHLIHEQLKQHKDCQEATANVLDFICKGHQDAWNIGCTNCCRRDDMTLIVRLFSNPSKLYGHKRNHSGTIFRSSFSYTSTSSGGTITPQPRSNDLVDMINNLRTNSPQSNRASPQIQVPVLLTNKSSTSGEIASPTPVSSDTISPSQVVFDPDSTEPYIKFGDDFRDDLVMEWIKSELNLPDNISEMLGSQ